MRTITAICIAAMLSGCAASTPQEARNMGPERRYVFEVDADYQTVYRRILAVERNCFQGQVLTATMLVNADLFPDTKSGNITVGMYGIISQIYQVIDIRGIDGDRTEVTATFPIGNVSGWGSHVKSWAVGNPDAGC